MEKQSRFRKILKWIGFVVAGLVGLLILAGVAIYFISESKMNQTYQVTIAPFELPADSAAIARGAHIAETRGCMSCHGDDLGGAEFINNPAMGFIYGPNLTGGEGGIGEKYITEDWVRAIRHGVRPSARPILIMPSSDYYHIDDADLGDLIAYLKQIPPVDRQSIATAPGPVARVLLATGSGLSAASIDHTAARPERVQPAVSVAYGAYLTALCQGCHGEDLSGGLSVGPPGWPQSANLTPSQSGLADWTEEDFFKLVRTGLRPDGREINQQAMPKEIGKYNDLELQAIWLYLRSIEPVDKQVASK